MVLGASVGPAWDQQQLAIITQIHKRGYIEIQKPAKGPEKELKAVAQMLPKRQAIHVLAFIPQCSSIHQLLMRCCAGVIRSISKWPRENIARFQFLTDPPATTAYSSSFRGK